MTAAQKTAFLVFSDDWGEHPSSCQHLFKRIALEYPVLWVNTVGMRNPKLTKGDLYKGIQKIRKMIGKVPSHLPPIGGNLKLQVYQPLMIPLPSMPGCRAVNRRIVIAGVRKKLSRMDFQKLILVTTVPNSCDYVGHFGEDKAVYYCVDDFTKWPGFEHTLVRSMEHELIEKCHEYIATSDKLYQYLLGKGKRTMLLSHGVDIDLFSEIPKNEHPCLADIPYPRVGYYGLFDKRTDQKLLAEIANIMPEISFVITGKIEYRAAELTKIPNIFFTGAVDYEELPAIVKGFQVCMLPYKINDLTSSISPLKLKEYMASGKPVICSPIPEALKMRNHLEIAANLAEWVTFIKKFVNTPPNSRKKGVGAPLLACESWDQKKESFLARVLN